MDIKRSYSARVTLAVWLLIVSSVTVANAQNQNTAATLIKMTKWKPSFNIALSTGSHGDTSKDIAHVYNVEEAAMAAQDPAISLLVSHGVGAVSEHFTGELLFVEYAPVFVSTAQRVNDISTQELLGILKGQLSDWSEIRGDRGPIHLYLHGGTLQKKAFVKLIEGLGVSRAKIEELRPWYAENYEELATVSSKDPYALFIGLRELSPNGLKMVKVAGVSITDVAHLRDYPLRQPVFLYAKNTAPATMSSFRNFVHVVNLRNNSSFQTGARSKPVPLTLPKASITNKVPAVDAAAASPPP